MKFILSSIIYILLCFNLQTNEYSLIDSVNIRKLFFYTETNWDKFVNTIKTYDKNTIGFICIKTIPKYIEKSGFENSIVNNLRKEDSSFLNYIYELNGSQYKLIDFVKPEEIKKVEGILNSINFNNYDYAMYFYTISENDKQNFYGRIFYQFNYKKELFECRFYFQESSNCYLLFSKEKPKRFDIILNGKKYREDLPYYFEFDSLKYLSRDSFLSLIRQNFGEEVLVRKNDFDIKNKLIEKIIIPALNPNYNEDGAKNEFGEYVLIKTEELQSGDKKGVNCSGFLKDIADNYIRLKHKNFKWLKISELKQKRLSERTNESYTRYENEYDPFFGLDWTKNIIDKINEYYGYNIIKGEELKDDKYAFYLENRGYYFDELQEILLRDQQKDSNYFYVAVFNKLRETKPMIPTFYHIAILVPYFQNNRFNIRVFESGEETSFSQMIKRMIPKSFTINKFEKDVLDRLEKKSDKKFILYAFNKGKNIYYLRDDLTLNEIIKTRNILSLLDFNKEKVIIFKIPIPMVEILE